MRWGDISFRPATRTLQQFAAAWLVFFGLLALQQQLRHGHEWAARVLMALGLLAGVGGLLRPVLVRWLYVGAMVAAFPIGWVVSRVAMAVIFYLVFAPLGLVLRFAGRNLLRRAPPVMPSYWVPKPGVANLRRYFLQF